MKYVKWEVVPGVVVPMIEDIEGQLWGTNKTVSRMLGISEDNVRKIYSANKEEFEPDSFEKLSVRDPHAKEFLKNHKAEFDIGRIRSDMNFWTDNDILTFCYRSTGQKAIEIRRSFTKFIKEHSKRHMVSKEEFEALQNQVSTLVEFVSRHLPAVESTASMAGRALRMQRDTKPLREMLH